MMQITQPKDYGFTPINGSARTMTTAGAWTDEDLSGEIGTGEKMVLFQIGQAATGAAANYIGLRKNGLAYAQFYQAWSTAEYNSCHVLVPCDANGIVEYYRDAAVPVGTVRFTVAGYFS